jgi:cell division septum initiation protein DivIVA
MLRPQIPIEPEHNGKHPVPHESSNGHHAGNSQPEGNGCLNVQQSLDNLEEMIIAGFRIPFTKRTVVDEEKLFDLLDYIRATLPAAFDEAMLINQQREEILLEAEEYGQRIVDAAQTKRAQILEESDIIRQAEHEALELKRKVQQECDLLMQQTLEEIDLKRRQCQQELEQMRAEAIAQATQIEQGADDYADSVLEHIEQDLNEMTRIIRNGRSSLNASRSPQKKK